jgi:hypothetical protein
VHPCPPLPLAPQQRRASRRVGGVRALSNAVVCVLLGRGIGLGNGRLSCLGAIEWATMRQGGRSTLIVAHVYHRRSARTFVLALRRPSRRAPLGDRQGEGVWGPWGAVEVAAACDDHLPRTASQVWCRVVEVPATSSTSCQRMLQSV